MRLLNRAGRPFLSLLLVPLLAALAPACDSGGDMEDGDGEPEAMFNLSHLDHLLEIVEQGGISYGIVHIYAEAPGYEWVGDEDEGIAALDDAARAAVVYFRHFELTGNEASREKAEALIRFVMYMQTDDGLFYNFVWNNELGINTTHENSRAETFGFWAARGVWALGTCAKVLKDADPAQSEACARRVRRSYPHIQDALSRYGQTTVRNGRTYPLWLLEDYAADSSSELLLGLAAMRQAYSDDELNAMIDRLAEGIAMMQFGDVATFPFGAHASWLETWHGWGNSQTQALAEAGVLESALREAEHFYPYLLVNGWRHSMEFGNPSGGREYEQIAYAVRCVAVGLVRLFDATGDEKHAILAGLAASWFTGNNVAGAVMYDAESGRGYDGITGPSSVNRNAGAESTIEANYTILEIERHPLSQKWMHARSGQVETVQADGKDIVYRTFTVGEDQAVVVLDRANRTTDVLVGEAATEFLSDPTGR
ncbi:MAG TPA: hypothetical protein VF190_05285 [Rhodothermales bacterium]